MSSPDMFTFGNGIVYFLCFNVWRCRKPRTVISNHSYLVNRRLRLAHREVYETGLIHKVRDKLKVVPGTALRRVLSERTTARVACDPIGFISMRSFPMFLGCSNRCPACAYEPDAFPLKRGRQSLLGLALNLQALPVGLRTSSKTGHWQCSAAPGSLAAWSKRTRPLRQARRRLSGEVGPSE
jgi:hypothetical protein